MCRDLGATSQPISWTPLGAANLTLTKQYPLNGANRVAMHLGVSQGGGGILNSGFWGIPLRQRGRYELSVYLRQPGTMNVRECHTHACSYAVHDTPLHGNKTRIHCLSWPGFMLPFPWVFC